MGANLKGNTLPTVGRMFVDTDGHDLTLWLERPEHPFGAEALVRECDVDRRVWALIVAAVGMAKHEVRVRTTGYGGAVTYCSCGHDGDYAAHVLEMLGVAA